MISIRLSSAPYLECSPTCKCTPTYGPQAMETPYHHLQYKVNLAH